MLRLMAVPDAARAVGVRPRDIRAAIRTGTLVVESVFGHPYLDRVDLALWRLALLAETLRGRADGRCPPADAARALGLLDPPPCAVGALFIGRCPVHRVDSSLVVDERGLVLCHFGCGPAAVLAALAPAPAAARPARRVGQRRPFRAKGPSASPPRAR